VDWLPTLAGMVGASNLVPKDRPIEARFGIVNAQTKPLGLT
jgi:hypothetical protein